MGEGRSRAQEAYEQARRAGRQLGERRDFTVTKFGRHENGYFHARVTPSGGKAVYVHCRHGSWLAPGTVHGKAVLKDIRKDVAEELSRMMRSAIRAEQRATEPTNQECGKIQDSHSQSSDEPEQE